MSPPRPAGSGSGRGLLRGLALVALVPLLALYVGAAIDPHLSVGSPVLALAVNALPLVLLFMAVLATTGRLLPALFVAVGVQAGVVAAGQLKSSILRVDLMYSDFSIIPMILTEPGLVLGFLPLERIAVVSAVALVLFVLSFLLWRGLRVGRPERAIAGVFALCLTGVLAWGQAPVVLPSIGWLLPMQIDGARHAGVTGNIVLGRLATRQVSHAYDPGRGDRFLRDVPPRPDTAVPNAPDIVVLQLESLFEPSLLCGMPDEPVLAAIDTLSPNGLSNLDVPVFGSRTLQTEFEVLTGAPVGFFTGSLFSYYDVLDGPVQALPRSLREIGYRTVAIHPSRASFWRRDFAMPALGFDQFISGDIYRGAADYTAQGWVRDDALARSMMSVLSASSGPAFVFGVSIENHGPWGQVSAEAIEDFDPAFKPEGVGQEALAEWVDFVRRARRTDRAVRGLHEALERTGRPYVLLVYSDHLPALKIFEDVCFKNGQPPQAQRTFFKIASNVEGPAPPRSSKAYLLPGLIAERVPRMPAGEWLATTHAARRFDAAADAEATKEWLADYAHVAAARILGDPPGRAPSEQGSLLRGERLAAILAPRSSAAPVPLPSGGDGLAFPLSAEAPLRMTLDATVRSLLVRPLSPLSDRACLGRPEPLDAWLNVRANGELIQRARMHPRDVLLLPLDVAGVDELRFEVESSSDAPCVTRLLLVAAAQCLDGNCSLKTAPAAAVADRLARPAPGEIFGIAEATRGMRTILRQLTDVETPANQPLRVTQVEHALFMHPGADQPATLSVSAFDQPQRLRLRPRIEPLDANCRRLKEGGIARATLEVGGSPVLTMPIDRRTRDEYTVSIPAGQPLRLVVDNGNGVAWCDWVSMAFELAELPPASAGSPVAAK